MIGTNSAGFDVRNVSIIGADAAVAADVEGGVYAAKEGGILFCVSNFVSTALSWKILWAIDEDVAVFMICGGCEKFELRGAVGAIEGKTEGEAVTADGTVAG